MEKLSRVEAALLFDLYGELLTPHQREVWKLYWQDDWSLSEIGGAMEVSRAAVHDVLERSERLLFGYERKLGLLASFRMRRQALSDLMAALAEAPCSGPWKDRALGAVRQMAREEGWTDV